MKKIQLYLIAILMLGLGMIGCNNNLEDSQSSTVDPKPTASIDVSNVADSTFSLTIGSNKAGYLGYVLADDTSLSVAAINILSGNLADKVLSTNAFLLAGAQDTTIAIKGLKQNSYYKVFVAASNTDGVESDMVSFVVKTNDGYAPNLIGASPSPSDEASVSIDGSLSFTFDEPVLVDTLKKFTFEYLIEGITEVVYGSQVKVSGSTITVPQTYTSHAGDYFTLSWEAGAITDLSGNAMDAITSSYDFAEEDGSMLYYRSENVSFSVADNMTTPKSGTVLVQHDFAIDIKFPYAISLLDDITSDMITFKYTDWQELSVVTVSGSEGLSVVGDSTLRIIQPYMAKHGDKIEVSISESVVEDIYNNENEASDYDFGWSLDDFHAYSATFTPGTDSILRVQEFTIKAKFDFPLTLINDSTGSQVYFLVIDQDGNELGSAPITPSIDAGNDSILLLPTPFAIPNFTSVLLKMEEGVVADPAGNVNLELKEEIAWVVEPELSYDINVLVGSYLVEGESYFGAASNISDTVTFVIKPGTTDSLICKGLFGFDGEVFMHFDATTSELTMEEQVIFEGKNSSDADRIYTVFANTDDVIMSGYVIKDGTMFISDLSMGVYDGSFEWLGFGNYLPSTKWTKIDTTPKSINVKSVKVTPSIDIFKMKKGSKF